MSDPAGLGDAQVRARVRAIVDRLVRAERDILDRRTSRDGGWDVPGDLDDYGDGTGLMAIAQHHLIKPMQEALDRADRELSTLRGEVDADKQRRIPGYQPPTDQEGPLP